MQRAYQRMNEAYALGMGAMNAVEPGLARALQCVLSRPGSLVRAVTSYLIGAELGMAEATASSLGCGIEYLHTASLIFDDLPSMDNAQLRRGAPCLHLTHGQATAKLAALALINRGYAMLWQSIYSAEMARRERAGHFIEQKLGVTGLLGGQAWDLQNGAKSSMELVSKVAAKKTADLLRLTLVLPAMAGHGTPHEIHLLNRLALLRGIAYQAADDLKDVYLQEKSTGKTTGRDEELGRPNLVLASGKEAALLRCQRLTSMADDVQKALPGPESRWQMLNILRVPIPCVFPGSLLHSPGKCHL